MRVICQVLWLFNCWTFQVSFVVCADSFVGSMWASDSDLEGLGGQAGCHMCWALGSRRSLFGWLVLCSVGASRRCYLGMGDSHLLLSRSDSNWCNTAPTCVKPSVTDFTQVWVPSGSTSPLHFRAALQGFLAPLHFHAALQGFLAPTTLVGVPTTNHLGW